MSHRTRPQSNETGEITVPESSKVKPILVLGVGNLLLKDEGVGAHFVEAFRKRTLPSGVEVVDGGARGIDLLAMIEGRKLVVIVDCARMGEPPGTIRTFEASEIIRKRGSGFSVHGATLAHTLKIGEHLGILPDIVILGIEPETVEICIGLSDVVTRAMEQAQEMVREIILKRD